MSYPPPSGSGYPGYPPSQPGGYPPAGGASGYPPSSGASGAYGQPGAAGAYGQQPYGQPSAGQGYPPSSAQGGYPPSSTPGGGYPPSSTPGGGYPPSSTPGGYPPSSTPGSYPPAQGGYAPQSGYPPTGAPSAYPPAHGGSSSQYGAPPSQPGAPQAWYGQYYNQINPQDMQVLQAWFSSVDKDRSGEISAPELAQLNFNNRLLGQEPARKLIAIFDKDRSGQINFSEYASLHQFLNTLLTQYQQSERKTPGSMSMNDVPSSLQAAGFSLSPTASQNVARRFDAQKRGLLTWDDFLALASHVALLRSVFEWSDTDRDGKVTFDFDAFAFATLYL